MQSSQYNMSFEFQSAPAPVEQSVTKYCTALSPWYIPNGGESTGLANRIPLLRDQQTEFTKLKGTIQFSKQTCYINRLAASFKFIYLTKRKKKQTKTQHTLAKVTNVFERDFSSLPARPSAAVMIWWLKQVTKLPCSSYYVYLGNLPLFLLGSGLQGMLDS